MHHGSSFLFQNSNTATAVCISLSLSIYMLEWLFCESSDARHRTWRCASLFLLERVEDSTSFDTFSMDTILICIFIVRRFRLGSASSRSSSSIETIRYVCTSPPPSQRRSTIPSTMPTWPLFYTRTPDVATLVCHLYTSVSPYRDIGIDAVHSARSILSHTCVSFFCHR